MAMLEKPLSELNATDVPILCTELPGPRSRALREREHRLHSPGESAAASLSGLVPHDGYGALIRDVDGNVLIDFCSGTVVVNAGHCPPQAVAALQEQVGRLMHAYDFTTEARVEFLEYLATLLPPELRMFQMYNSGTEAVEAAVKLAKAYTKKYEVISFFRGYHGKTLTSMSLMGGAWKAGYGPFAAGHLRSPNAFCYRCPLRLEYPSCGVACADFLDETYIQMSDGKVAAVIVEPVQGSGGVIVPPPEFLQKVRAWCDRNGALLIFDEILTGAGRTGSLWAFEAFGVRPDILVTGKGVGSGFPMGIVASDPKIMDTTPWNLPGSSANTFGGNPMAAAVALATLKQLVEDRVPEHAARVGAMMKGRLLEMQRRYPCMGDVRGMGLLLGVEFVRDRQEKTPITADEAQFLYREMTRRGLFTSSPFPVVRIVPPLVITEALANRGLDLMDEAIGALQRRIDGQ